MTDDRVGEDHHDLDHPPSAFVLDVRLDGDRRMPGHGPIVLVAVVLVAVEFVAAIIGG